MDTIIAFCNENFGIVFKHKNRRKQQIVSRCGERNFSARKFWHCFQAQKSAKKPTKNSVFRYEDHMGFTGFNSQSTLIKYFQTVECHSVCLPLNEDTYLAII